MDDQTCDEDREPASDGLVFAPDDPVREGLARDESDEVAAGLSDDAQPTRLSFSENSDTNRTGDEVERHADGSELGSQRHRCEQHGEGLERDRDAERFGRDRDLREDRGEEDGGGDAEESERCSIERSGACRSFWN